MPKQTSWQIHQAVELLQNSGVVAFPTETVYGLGANALDAEAVSKIYQIKGRPSNNPLIIHIAEESQLNQVARDIPMIAKILINNFWPGPLTLILSRNLNVPDITAGGLDTVAVRMPNHPIALKLLKQAKLPIAAPSANTSGKPSPTTAEHVQDDLGSKVDLIIDGGPTSNGLESTILDLTSAIPTILRPGPITLEQISKLIGQVEVAGEASVTPKAPGMAYRHYAPDANLQIIEDADFVQEIVDLASKAIASGKKVGILTTKENILSYPTAAITFNLGHRGSLNQIAQNLFSGLHYMNQQQVDIIFSEPFPTIGVGAAINNRLKKAANS